MPKMRVWFKQLWGCVGAVFSRPILDPHMQFLVDQNRKIREEIDRWHFTDEIEEDARWW